MPSRQQFTAAAAPSSTIQPPLLDVIPHSSRFSSSSSSSSPSSSTISKIHRSTSLVAGLAAGGGITAAIAFLVFLLLLYRKLRGSKTSPYDVASVSKLQKFSYRELKAATRAFSSAQKLGQGGFGAVYKGQLRNGQEIAVKVLDGTSLQGEREFQNEVSVIGKLSSPHIVGLTGFCADRKRRLLVYEYMQNRSLQDALFDDGYRLHLDWGKRFRIIVDTAAALAFLHTECDPPIIHGDIKPSNILLDGSFSARIADFGLARLKTEANAVDVGGELDAERQCMERERARSHRRRHRTQELVSPRQKIQGNACADDKSAKEETDSVFTVEDGYGEACSTPRKMQDAKNFNGDRDPSVLLNMQSPETCVSNSSMGLQSPEGNLVLSSYASPEGLQDETDTITETQDGRSPSEIVDLEKNVSENGMELSPKVNNNPEQNRARAKDHKGIDFSRDEGEGEDKASLSEGCYFDKISLDSGKHGLPNVREGRKKNSLGRDWWWKQESSGEFSVKDYVMEWIGTEIRKERPKSSWRSEDSGEQEAGAAEGKKTARKKQRQRQKRKECLEWWATLDEENVSEEPRKKDKSKCREGREWWKEEFCEELSNKNAKGRLKRDQSKGREWWREDLEEDRDAKAKKRDKNKSRSRDWWGDDHHNSGELRGRDWGSGDLLRSGVSSTPSMRGTVCYVAPESGGGGGLPSEKSDVYSFGVLMLVIISGRRPLQVMASPITEFERANLISWARHLAHSGNVLDLVDATLRDECDKDQAVLAITVALLCLQRLPSARPTMTEVVKILSREAEAPSLPFDFSPSPPYGFPFRSRRKAAASSSSLTEGAGVPHRA